MNSDSHVRELSDYQSAEDRNPVDCWIVCQERRQDALENGYEGLVSVLKGTLGPSAVTDFITREQFKGHIRTRISDKRGGRLLIVGHLTDLQKIQSEIFRDLAGIEGLDVLELHFTTVASAPDVTGRGEVNEKPVPYCSIREILAALSRATPDDLASQNQVNQLVEKYRAEAQTSILDPLLPLAVLVDGFLVVRPQDPTVWFKPGIDTALETSSRTPYPLGSSEYWHKLIESRSAVEHVGEILENQTEHARGFAAALMTARNLGWARGDTELESPATGEAGALYRHACGAVKAAWEALTSSDGVPHEDTEMRELIEAASVGFHVLAAGHL